MSYISIDKDTYFNSHGKMPRGLGGWWFELLGDGFGQSQTTQIFEHFGMFSDAKKAAVKRARELGATTVKVLS